VFLFDEPLSNLDAKLRVEMRTEIKKLHQRVQKTTVYVTHDQVEAMTLASRIAVMHKGVLQQYAEPREVYERPANMFVAGFMGSPSMNFLGATVAAAGDGPGLRLDGAGADGPVLAVDPARLGSRKAGEPVVLGVRPEHFHPPARIRAARSGLLTAPVEVVEPAGNETMAVLRLAGREVMARFEPDDAPRVGEAVTVAIDMDKASLFDPVSEKRL
jgi:multiple sugar transport system ATP-binding protein